MSSVEGASRMKSATAWRHDEYERIYLHHVRKTAGTAVSFSFMRLSGTDPRFIERELSRRYFAQSHGYRYVAGSPKLISQGKYFFAFSHNPAHTIELPRAGTFEFTVLRDPVERVVSLYRYLAYPEADSSFSLVAPVEEQRWASEGFDRFLDQIPRQHLTNQLYTFSGSWSVDEAVDRLNNLNMVLHTERLSDGLRCLQESLNLQLSLTRERASVLPFTPNDVQRNRLHDLLAPEFEILRQIDVTDDLGLQAEGVPQPEGCLRREAITTITRPDRGLLMVFYRAMLPLSPQGLSFVAGIIRARGPRPCRCDGSWTRRGRRCLS